MSGAALNLILRFLAPCGHDNESWPMRLPGEAMAHRTCLECGRRRPYHLLEPENRTRPEAPSAALHRLPLRLIGPERLTRNRGHGMEKGKLLAA